MMKTFTCTDHTDAERGLICVVVAKTREDATALLDKHLKERSACTSSSDAYTLAEVIPETAVVLQDKLPLVYRIVSK